jgi:hypothetical protein
MGEGQTQKQPILPVLGLTILIFSLQVVRRKNGAIAVFLDVYSVHSLNKPSVKTESHAIPVLAHEH